MTFSESCMGVSIGLTHSSCASWVQAWGSILAIVVSAFVAVGLYRRSLADVKQRSEEQMRQRRRTISSLFGKVLPIYEKASDVQEGVMPDVETGQTPEASLVAYLNYKSDAFGLEHDIFAIDSLQAALTRIDVSELFDAQAAEAFIAGLFAVHTLSEHLRAMRDAEGAQDTLAAYLFGGFPSGLAAVKAARNVFGEG